MSEPKRWSESGSDVDPVLRSVMRYSKEQGPTKEQVREMLRAARSAKPQGFLSRLTTKRARPLLLAAAAVVASGASFAAYQVYGARSVVLPHREATPPTSESAAPRPPRASRAPSTEPRPGAATEPPSAAFAPEAPDEVTTPPAKPVPGAPAAVAGPSERPRPGAEPPKKPAPVAEDELALLEQARRTLQSDPAAALALTRDHAARHPSGAFAEERDALTIEALRRLNRHEEAVMKLRSFEARYPRSPYRRRLGIGK